ncbi:hypothetical protein JNJ66_05200 [Candidatus Saccharibacteria bacterium]|nr:hypothetical protein [Candidatus Saccharibacteria bacterium]
MTDRPVQVYQCVAAGHLMPSRDFDAAPKEWFTAKGLSTPKYCGHCRQIMGNHRDRTIACVSCQDPIPLNGKYMITYHKHVGVYKIPEQCVPCKEGKAKRVRRGSRPKRELRRRAVDLQQDRFGGLPEGRPPQPLPVETDISQYQHRLSRGETREEHIERHILLAPGSKVGQIEPGRTTATSESALFADIRSVPDALKRVEVAVREVGADVTREYLLPRGRIARVFLVDDSIEVTFLDPRPDGKYEVVSSYDNNTLQAVRNLARGHRPNL